MMPADEFVARIRSGDVRALARAVSLVENGAPESRELLSTCFPMSRRALRLGITGVPGAGKSTLVSHLVQAWRAEGSKAAVVAVDPSSPFTGGALLGDRIRIQERAGSLDEINGIYVRSMATRGALGGLAETTGEVVDVIAASGRDVILIETVGVGQDEVEIVRLADVTVVVVVPGMGDAVQSLKAGIMEIADIFVINKADREGADRLEKEILSMQSLVGVPVAVNQWSAPVVKTVGTTGEGVEDLFAAIGRRSQWLAQEGRLTARREAFWRNRIEKMLREALINEAGVHGIGQQEMGEYAEQVAMGTVDPYQLIPALTKRLFNSSKELQ
jgi:LAO/AO transport system kinase